MGYLLTISISSLSEAIHVLAGVAFSRLRGSLSRAVDGGGIVQEWVDMGKTGDAIV